jgi:hypothetical protein
MPTTCWGVTRRAWLGRQAFALPGQQQPFDDYVFAVDQLDRRIGVLEAEIDRIAEHRADRQAALSGWCRHAYRVRVGREVRDFTRFKTAEQFMGLRRPGPIRALLGRLAPAGLDHQGGLQPCASAAGGVGLARAPAPDRRLRPCAPPPRPRSCRPGTRVALSAAAASPRAADGRPRQAPPENRRRLRPRAGPVRQGDRNRPTAEQDLINQHRPSVGWRAVPPRRRTLASTMRRPTPGRPATLDRGSSRRTPLMRSRPANVSLIHRRCPGTPAIRRPPRSAPPRAGP